MASLQDIVRNILPDNDYTVKVESVEVGESKNSGQAKLAFQATVTSGDQRGKTLWWSRSLQPQALWRLAGDLIQAGFDAEVGDDPSKFAAALAEIAEQMVVQTYNVKVTTSDGRNGSRFNDVEIRSPFSRVGDVGQSVGAVVNNKTTTGPKRVTSADI